MNPNGKTTSVNKNVALQIINNNAKNNIYECYNFYWKWWIRQRTPAGQVGTARVTFGQVLTALQGFRSFEVEAYDESNCQQIMNHIAYNFLKEKMTQN